MYDDKRVTPPEQGVNLPRRMPQNPAKRFDRMLMSNRIGEEAKRGYPEPQRKFIPRCKTCFGKKKIRAFGGIMVNCPRCGESSELY